MNYKNASVFEEDKLVAKYVGGIREMLVDDFFLNYKVRESIDDFLKSRVMPKAAWRDKLVDFYGIPEWNPLEICKRTHGMMPIDTLWIKFEGESDDIDWATVQQQIW